MLGLGNDMKYLNLFKLVLLGASTTEMSNLNNLYLYMYIVIHVLCRYSICISCHVTDPNTISVINVSIINPTTEKSIFTDNLIGNRRFYS